MLVFEHLCEYLYSAPSPFLAALTSVLPMGIFCATYGRPLGDLWVTFGRPLGDLWEQLTINN